MDSSKWTRIRGLMATITSWMSKPERKDAVGDSCTFRKSKSTMFDCEFKTTSPLQDAAIKYDSKLVDNLLTASEDVTTDLMHEDNLGFTAFYYIMKNCPSSIEKLLYGCIKFGNKEKNYEIGINFSSLSKRDENIFFEEICKMKNDPSLRDAFDRAFLHPTTEAYFFERWSQIKYAYYMVPLFSHFVYSVAYSTYSIIVYRVLCGASITPLESGNSNLDMAMRSLKNVASNPKLDKPSLDDTDSTEKVIRKLEYATTLERNCSAFGYYNGTGSEEAQMYVAFALTSWIVILITSALMIMQEVCKFLYYRSEKNLKRYFVSMETIGYVWLIISVVLISFHQDPFGEIVVLKPFQYHAAAMGVFTTWFVQMLLMRRIPKVGMFIEMLWPVSATFFQFFVGYGYLLAAFACSFYILFPDKYAFKNGLPATFVKVTINKCVSYTYI